MNNTTANETVLILGKGAPPIHVEQGPNWLVKLYLAPPWWLNPALKSLAAVTAAFVAYRLYQRGFEINFETQHEMQIIVGYIVLISTGVLAMVNWTNQPYLVDTSVGFVAGYAAVFLPQTRIFPIEWPDVLSDPVDRNIVMWTLLALSAYALPLLARVNGMGMGLMTSRLFLAGLGVVMAMYNAVLLKGS